MKYEKILMLVVPFCISVDLWAQNIHFRALREQTVIAQGTFKFETAFPCLEDSAETAQQSIPLLVTEFENGRNKLSISSVPKPDPIDIYLAGPPARQLSFEFSEVSGGKFLGVAKFSMSALSTAGKKRRAGQFIVELWEENDAKSSEAPIRLSSLQKPPNTFGAADSDIEMTPAGEPPAAKGTLFSSDQKKHDPNPSSFGGGVSHSHSNAGSSFSSGPNSSFASNSNSSSNSNSASQPARPLGRLVRIEDLSPDQLTNILQNPDLTESARGKLILQVLKQVEQRISDKATFVLRNANRRAPTEKDRIEVLRYQKVMSVAFGLLENVLPRLSLAESTEIYTQILQLPQGLPSIESCLQAPTTVPSGT